MQKRGCQKQGLTETFGKIGWMGGRRPHWYHPILARVLQVTIIVPYFRYATWSHLSNTDLDSELQTVTFPLSPGRSGD